MQGRRDGRVATTLDALGAEPRFDVVVVGAGAAGLSAAVFAARRGASVLLVERTGLVGGTSALTAGTLWVPGTEAARAAGAPEDDLEAAGRFLDAAVEDRSDPLLRRAYLQAGPPAIAELLSEPAIELDPREFHPDYMAEVADSATGLRAFETRTLSGAGLPGLGLVRQQTEEFTVFGGMMLARTDIADFSEVAREPWRPRNWGRALRAAGILAAHLATRPFHPRATRLTMGNALVARLLTAARAHGVELLLDSTVERIEAEGGRVTAVEIAQGRSRERVIVGSALIAATGGFNRSPERRERLIPASRMEWSPIAPGSTGQLHELVEGLGGHYGEVIESAAFWAPVSLPPRRGGGHGVYPHFALDRAKPGFLVVDRRGDRYLNESTSYHRFGLAMQAHPDGLGIPGWLVADAAAVKRYGIGAVRPGGWGIRRRLRDGYLLRGATVQELAVEVGVDPARLQGSIDAINRAAETGADPDFHRGTTVYERTNGDPSHGPNPSLGRLTRGPFYAIRLYPGDIGAVTGFVTDADSRVLDREGSPVAGLYAIGNDMQSVMGDRYPAPGVTLGPAVVFAYRAVRHALGEADGSAEGAES